ncbi:Hypothetical protein AKI40_0949 [Enterobacter sp. FY-07]|nr:Hypothetical protein AKI40_0949 [Enterobacter sp. FY-07]
MAPQRAMFRLLQRRNKKTPVKVFIVLVAGAGFEPTTFGL